MLELENRRSNMFNKMANKSVAILFAGTPKICSEDEFMDFTVNKNFYYFTNIKQEESVLVLAKGFGGNKTYLFVQEYSELKEKWTGKRLTNEQAGQIAGINNVYSLNALENTLNLLFQKDGMMGTIETVYIDLQKEAKIGEDLDTVKYAEQIKAKYNVEVKDAYPLVRDLRMIKSSYEIENMVKAINLTNNGLALIIRNLKPGMKEYELADCFEFYGRQNGRHGLAFNTIVAAGKNATCLHYPSQNDTIKDGDTVLFDLGYNNELYCADISRTYPVNGQFNTLQAAVYTAVLNCNKAVIDHVRAGMTIKELQEFATEFLRKECIRLNLMQEDEDIRKYYYHGVSHFLGLDTHDIGLRERPLEDGNVITVEPGLYFEKYGIGVRIEDDVLIRNGVGENLSIGIKKEIADIEKLFKTRGF